MFANVQYNIHDQSKVIKTINGGQKMAMQTSLYERDFYAWTIETARLLKEKAFNQIDIDHLREEIESMGASERRELQSRLEVLIMHLLKWEYQPDRQGKSWLCTIKEQRTRIKDHLNDNPSLKPRLNEILAKAYSYAVISCSKETDLEESAFPESLPYTLDQLLDDNYLP